MKTYNFNKAIELIEANKEILESASLGMHEDWFWTAETVFEQGEFIKVLPENGDEIWEEYKDKRKAGMRIFDDESRKYDNILIGGIYGSDWATPTLQLVFKDGEDKMIDVSKGDSERQNPGVFTSGCLSGPVQDNITPISE